MLSLSGIAIIALSWLLQLSSTSRGKDKVEPTFILTYGIGTALLLTDSAGYGGFTTGAWMYLMILLIVGLLYLKMHR